MTVVAPVVGSSLTISAASRREYSTEPFGRVTRPQGMSESVATVVEPQTGVAHAAWVVADAPTLGEDALPAEPAEDAADALAAALCHAHTQQSMINMAGAKSVRRRRLR